MSTPKKAKSIVSVYKSLKKRKGAKSLPVYTY